MYIIELVCGLRTGLRLSSLKSNETNFIDLQLSKTFRDLTLVLDKVKSMYTIISVVWTN